MKKPIIGIVARPHTTYTQREVSCTLDGYRRAVLNAGGIPIIILSTQNISYEATRPKDAPRLNEEEKNDLIVQIDLCDGLIFPGGNRIYDYDYFICDYAMKNNLNILGICMGMQLLACSDCEKERSEILEKIDSNINHNQIDKNYVHKIKISKDSFLYKTIEKEEIDVNSRHKYCVNKTNKFKIIAKSEDGFIEAIENMENSFMLGVQWHPETMERYDDNMKKIFKEFINACKK